MLDNAIASAIARSHELVARSLRAIAEIERRVKIAQDRIAVSAETLNGVNLGDRSMGGIAPRP